jgi:hypothetical protein
MIATGNSSRDALGRPEDMGLLFRWQYGEVEPELQSDDWEARPEPPIAPLPPLSEPTSTAPARSAGRVAALAEPGRGMRWGLPRQSCRDSWQSRRRWRRTSCPSCSAGLPVLVHPEHVSGRTTGEQKVRSSPGRCGHEGEVSWAGVGLVIDCTPAMLLWCQEPSCSGQRQDGEVRVMCTQPIRTTTGHRIARPLVQ